MIAPASALPKTAPAAPPSLRTAATPAASTASTPSQTFNDLIQRLIGTSPDTPEPDADTTTDVSVPVAVAVPLPASVVLPLHFSLPSFARSTKADKDSNADPGIPGPESQSLAAPAVPTAPVIQQPLTMVDSPDVPGKIPAFLQPVESEPRLPVEITTESKVKSPIAFEVKLTPSTKANPTLSEPATASRPNIPAPGVVAAIAAPSAATSSEQQPSDKDHLPPQVVLPKTPVKQLVEKTDDMEPVTVLINRADEATTQPVVSADNPQRTESTVNHAPAASTSAELRPISEPPDPLPKTTPVRDLSFRLTSASNEQVDVKVQDRGGELRVAVRSASPELNADLRQQVNELVSKLDRTGFHSEIVKSASDPIAAGVSTQRGDGESRQESSGQQQQQQQSTPRPRKSRQPQWLQEMTRTTGSIETEGVHK